MKYYDEAQGKVIDTAQQTAGNSLQSGQQAFAGQQGQQQQQNVSGGPVGGGQDVNSTPYGGESTTLGVPESNLRNAFFKMGLANPKEAGNLNSLLSIVTEPAAQRAADLKANTAAQTSADSLKKGNAAIDTIYNTWKKGINSSTINRVKAMGASITGIGALSPEQVRMNATFYTSLEPELRKAVISGRITQQEINWLRTNLMPNAFDSEESAQQKVQSLKDAFSKTMQDPGTGDQSQQVNPINPVGL